MLWRRHPGDDQGLDTREQEATQSKQGKDVMCIMPHLCANLYDESRPVNVKYVFCYTANIPLKKKIARFITLPGLHPDHVRGALLWWLWNERPTHELREELQPAALHVHNTLYQEWTSTRGTQRAIQEEDHPHHHARLSLRQDSDQCHPERGGKHIVHSVSFDCCTGLLLQHFMFHI